MTAGPEKELLRRYPALATEAHVRDCLSDAETRFLAAHLGTISTVESLWSLMDDVWDDCGAGYSSAEEHALAAFYRSPVWLLNGLFTDADPESQRHRVLLADYVASLKPSTVADFGGGFGSLSRLIATKCPSAAVRTIEPYPTKLAVTLAQARTNHRYADAMDPQQDVVIAQDVLEHVTDPLDLFAYLLDHVRVGGFLITANCFKPVIKCHYPGADHFNFTFRHVITPLDCRFVGKLPGATHIEIFERTGGKRDMAAARRRERLSSTIHPVLSTLQKLRG